MEFSRSLESFEMLLRSKCDHTKKSIRTMAHVNKMRESNTNEAG